MLYGAVFAGGLSSRMGQDKAGLQHRGQTLLDKALALLEACGADRVLVSGDIPGRDCIPDRRGRRGPPGALYSLVQSLQESDGLNNDLLLVIPVDMPYLDVEVCRVLIKEGGGAQAARFGEEVFPCLFRLNQALLDCLDTGLSEEDAGGKRFSMKAILAARQALQLDDSGFDATVFDNINRPQDWDRYISR